MRKLMLAAVAAVVLPAAAQAAPIITNGSFETSTTVQGGPAFVTLNNGSTAIDGWTVTAGSIDYILSYWPAQDGSRSIDLSGNEPGAISQTFNTIANQRYVVKFFLGGNFDGPPPSKTIQASAGDFSGTFTYTPTGTGNFQGYNAYSFGFVGTGSPTTLTFASLSSGPFGAALDNVSVTAVPEPASWALMIAGFGLAGAALRSRRRPVAALA